MTTSPTPAYDEETLRRVTETFEHKLEHFRQRVMTPEDRVAMDELSDSWSSLVDVLFGPLGHVRTCVSCRRSQVRVGPRCVYCWHRFVASSPASPRQDEP